MKTSPKELFDAGVHIGHQQKRWNPKTRPYVYDHRGKITVINLEKTCEQIDRAWDFMRNTVASGGDIWFVGTKRQACNIIREGANAVEMPFCATRWLGGTLTNFSTIERSLTKYKKFLQMEESGELAKLPKKESASIRREMNRLHSNFEGMMSIKALPSALFVVDVKHEYITIAEAKRLDIPVVAMVDTNSDPTLVDYPIVANDDSEKSIRLIIGLLLEGIQEGMSNRIAKHPDMKKLISKDDLVQIDADVTISTGITEEVDAEIEASEASTDSEVKKSGTTTPAPKRKRVASPRVTRAPKAIKKDKRVDTKSGKEK